MKSYFFWDIENVSIHNLGKIMDIVLGTPGDRYLYAVFSKIKESRKVDLSANGWTLVRTKGISRNSADKEIKKIIESLIEIEKDFPEKIFLISEDKGFAKISQRIISKGIQLEVIRGSKDPQWIKDLETD
jgi:hypothetical protein